MNPISNKSELNFLALMRPKNPNQPRIPMMKLSHSIEQMRDPRRPSSHSLLRIRQRTLRMPHRYDNSMFYETGDDTGDAGDFRG